MVIPVTGSQVKFVGPKKATVQLRVEVLGYALNASAIKVRSVPATRIVKAKLDGLTPLVVGPDHGGGRPAAQGQARDRGRSCRSEPRAGRRTVGASRSTASTGRPPGRRSAPIVAGKPYTSLVVAEVGTDGKLVIAPSVAAKVRATIVGYIHR